LFYIVFENQTLQLFLAIFAGLLLGSFCTAVVYREKNDKSWIWNRAAENKARSFCPSCSHVLGVRDLIPIFSWLFQFGKCRYCKVKISSSYIITELTLVFLCVLIWLWFDFTFKALILIVMSPFVVAQLILLFQVKKFSYCLLGISFMGIFLVFLEILTH